MRVRVTVVAALLFGLQLAAASSAAADDNPILVLDGSEVTLTKADGGTATASVTVENQGTGRLGISAAVAGASDTCVPTADPPRVEAHQQQAVTLTFPSACDPLRDKGFNFTVTVGTTALPTLHAKPPADPDPDWAMVLLIFGGAAFFAACTVVWAWNRWDRPTNYPTATGEKGGSIPLPGLEASWKFSDSWAANATVVTALFTGLFGTEDVTNALLGEGSAKDLLAVALVSAAISVGLVGISPMVLQALRVETAKRSARSDGDPKTKDMPAGLYATPKGILWAGWLTLTGTGGQLAVLTYQLRLTKFGNDYLIVVTGLIGAVLLIWYARKATDQNLTVGARLPPAEEKPAEGEKVVVERDEEEKEEAMEEFAAAPMIHLTLEKLREALGEDGKRLAVTVVMPAAPPPAAEPRRPAGIL